MDLLAVFEAPEDAIGTVNKLIMAGIMPTCVEYMDNITIKSVERYLCTSLQGSDKGNYLIVEVEGTSEDDLDEKACTMDEICSENGAGDVLVAEHDKIWQARKAFAEAVRAESLIVCKEDVVCPVDPMVSSSSGRAMLSRLVHPSKALSPILVMVPGSSADVMDRQ